MKPYKDPTADTAIRNVSRRGYRRGEIYYICKDKRLGSEQEAGRPAVIVSNNYCNDNSPCVEVVYLTTQDKPNLPTHTTVVCREISTALCEQIHTVDKKRFGKYIKKCTKEEMRAIDIALMISLGLMK